MNPEPVHVPNDIDFPRIPQRGFIAAIFTFLAVAIVGAGIRIGVRIFRSRTFGFDDAFLLLALSTLAAACGIMQLLGDTTYIQIYAASVLEWVSIYSAKVSLLLFFRKLVFRVRPLEVLWMIVTGLVAIFACICIPLGFMICHDFSPNFVKTCRPNLINSRERTYTDVSTIFDIVSDVSILSIPLGLLWMVRVSMRRKVALASMLCLSIFMIVIAIVRVAAFLLPGHVTDTVWLFFWQTMEAAVAVIMVALTGFRSLFQSDQAKDSRREQGYSGGNQHGLVTLGSSNNKYDKLDSSGNNSLPQIGRSLQDAQKPQVV